MNSLAVAMGGGVRVGLEDSVWYDVARTSPARNQERDRLPWSDVDRSYRAGYTQMLGLRVL
ncbi:MAG: 3-keto-5-aminohexanoate cleavage protein [Armatimonadetes bacterium]|nr:3-keto-5-aminohexanoate cleavage protein [Armatimonadota bacterium]